MPFLADGSVSPAGLALAVAGAKTAAAQNAVRNPETIRRVILPPI
jgi:hypothetical protein